MAEIYPVLSNDQKIMHIIGLPIEIGVTTTKAGCHKYKSLFSDNMKKLEILKNQLQITKVLLINPENKSNVIKLSPPFAPFSRDKCDGYCVIEPGYSNDTLVGIPLGDCPGVWLYCKNIVALIHSGWRSTLENIAGKTVNDFVAFGIYPDQIKVIIWPGICQKDYQVGDEFNDYFPGRVINGCIDLSLIIENQLLNAGIPFPNITTINNFCTYCSRNGDNHLFYSRRRGDSERSLAYMVI